MIEKYYVDLDSGYHFKFLKPTPFPPVTK
jgi:hypothetical protein